MIVLLEIQRDRALRDREATEKRLEAVQVRNRKLEAMVDLWRTRAKELGWEPEPSFHGYGRKVQPGDPTDPLSPCEHRIHRVRCSICWMTDQFEAGLELGEDEET